MHDGTGISAAAIERAWDFVGRLTSEIGARVAGTDAERAAASLIVAEYEERGLQVTRQPFRWVGWEPVGRPRVIIRKPDGTTSELATASMAFTGSTPSGGVSGRLVPAGTCELVPGLLEWPRYAVEVDGQPVAFVAVVPDGKVRPFPRPERQLLQEAIAIVGADEFATFAARCDRGEQLDATIETQGRFVEGNESSNIIAELPGDSPETIVISGHYDTVAGTPGAGDNASGVAGCLALAEYYSGKRPAKTLRFINWGAHEFGLLGSQFYAQDLAQRGQLSTISAALALDILSDGDRLGIWVGKAPFAAELAARRDALPNDFPIELHPTGRGETDSWSFAERGIDTAMFLTLPYAHFHLPSDSLENNDGALFAFSVRVAQRMVDQLLTR
jgi:hypothetical protein